MEALEGVYQRVAEGEAPPSDATQVRLLLARARSAARSDLPDDRARAARVSAALLADGGLTVLRGLARDADPDVAATVLDAARALGDDALMAARELTGSPVADVRVGALEHLAACEDHGATPYARRALTAAEPAVKVAALRLLAVVGGPGLRPQLARFADDADVDVARAARAALDALTPGKPAPAPASPEGPRDTAWEDGLVPDDADADEPSADPFRDELATTDPRALSAAVRRAAGSPDPVTRAAAADAARTSGSASFAGVVRKLLTDADPAVRAASARATGALAGAAALPALAALLTDADPAVRAAAAEGLGALGSPRALPFLQPHAADTDETFAAAVADAIAALSG